MKPLEQAAAALEEAGEFGLALDTYGLRNAVLIKMRNIERAPKKKGK